MTFHSCSKIILTLLPYSNFSIVSVQAMPEQGHYLSKFLLWPNQTLVWPWSLPTILSEHRSGTVRFRVYIIKHKHMWYRLFIEPFIYLGVHYYVIRSYQRVSECLGFLPKKYPRNYFWIIYIFNIYAYILYLSIYVFIFFTSHWFSNIHLYMLFSCIVSGI